MTSALRSAFSFDAVYVGYIHRFIRKLQIRLVSGCFRSYEGSFINTKRMSFGGRLYTIIPFLYVVYLDRVHV